MEQSYARALEFDGLYEQAMLLEKLSALKERTGQYSDALDYLKRSHSLRDSLASSDRERMILDMAESYRSEQSAQEIERLREQEAMSDKLIATQQVFLIVVSLVLIAFVVAFVLMVRSNRHAHRLNDDLADANVRLTNLSEERNNLIHVMAHDLRTPLAQVSGLNELLKDSGNVTTEQLEYIQLIDSASKNGLSLIAQMMESVNREQLERPSRIHEDVDLHGVIDGSLSLYEAQARNKNIRLIFDNETDDPVVKSDAQAIRRVIDNLVSNAIKYTFPDTEVRVTLTSTDHNATICVKDSGPGFSEDDKALLFRKFTTLSARPTGNESSTGLGLAIVNDLLAEIGGTVALVDDGKPGAYFCVTIPRDEKRDTRHETRDARHETRDTRHKI
jgi:signal transduction histidine kinase